jgi:hypothetical protein
MARSGAAGDGRVREFGVHGRVQESNTGVPFLYMLPEEPSRLNALLVLSVEATLRVKFNIDVKQRRSKEKELARNHLRNLEPARRKASRSRRDIESNYNRYKSDIPYF